MHSRPVRPGRGWFGLLFGLVVFASPVVASSWEPVMVYSENFNGYKRTRGPDGKFKPESFAFGEGKRFDAAIANNEVNELPFGTVIRALARPLAQQNYVPAADATHADLLILVYWGVTEGSADLIRDGLVMSRLDLMQDANSRDMFNARLLGYRDKVQTALDVPFMSFAQDIVEEVSESRYFVVMQAFDFQLLWKQHKQKLLWETRFSIGEQGNAFAEQLAGMVQRAAPFFGNGSGRLVRRALPEGHVEVGEPVEVKDVKR